MSSIANLNFFQTTLRFIDLQHINEDVNISKYTCQNLIRQW